MTVLEHFSLGPATLEIGGCAEAPQVAPVIRNRPQLVDGDSADLPATLAPAREGFPLLVRPSQDSVGCDLEDWARVTRKLLDERLEDVGAILIRGLPLRSIFDFSELLVALEYEPFLSPSVAATREDVAPRVSMANVAPADMNIMMHNEMAYYFPDAPRHFFLYCECAPAPGEGGETPIARNADYHTELDEDIIAHFERRGLRRDLRFFDAVTRPDRKGRSWQVKFDTHDRSTVEERCREKGMEFRWEDDGSLMTQGRPAVTIPRAGRRQWICAPQHAKPASTLEIRYGDGAPIEPEILEHLRAVQWKIAVAFAWQDHDLLCLDNLGCQHGRLSYSAGSSRRVFVSTASSYSDTQRRPASLEQPPRSA